MELNIDAESLSKKASVGKLPIKGPDSCRSIDYHFELLSPMVN